MYRKSLRRRMYERKAARCAAMRAAKERKRRAEAGRMRDVGGFVTDGCLGAHRVRLLAWPNDEPRLAVLVDGRARRPRTHRGVLRRLAEMIYGQVQGKR